MYDYLLIYLCINCLPNMVISALFLLERNSFAFQAEILFCFVLPTFPISSKDSQKENAPLFSVIANKLLS
jgi:hypothetical protein